jgi:hypothetical protein
MCGSTRLVWRKCKQICLDCGGINRSCADLAELPACATPDAEHTPHGD